MKANIVKAEARVEEINSLPDDQKSLEVID